MKYEKQISKAIKRISKERGITYGQIAIKLGISKSGVNNWVWRNQIPIDSMLKVCEVFDMEIMDFLKPEEGEKKIDVVRCKDCKHYGNLYDGTCEHPAAELGDMLATEPTNFCSYGERSEE